MSGGTSEPVEIRFGRAAEVDELVRIWLANWDESAVMLRDAGLQNRPTARNLRAKFAPAIGRVIVATVAETIVGFCHRQDAEIEELWIDPSHHGRGIGLILMNRALSLMRADGHKTALLECLELNVRARRFYEREGWRQTSRFIRKLDHTEYAMIGYEKEI